MLATNVAETSLTVPGIRYVIDPGLARVKRYSLRNKTTLLQIEKISQAAASSAPAAAAAFPNSVCVRLYGETTSPRGRATPIQKSCASSRLAVILRMAALDLAGPRRVSVRRVRRVRARSPTAISCCRSSTRSTRHAALTPRGRELARLPLDPRVGRILQAARERELRGRGARDRETRSRVPDPRERAAGTRAGGGSGASSLSRRALRFPVADRAVRVLRRLRAPKLSHRKLVERCRARFVSYLRLREWRDDPCTARDRIGRRRDGSGLRQLAPTIDAPRYAAISQGAAWRGCSAIGSARTEDDDGFDGARGIQLPFASGFGHCAQRREMAARRRADRDHAALRALRRPESSRNGSKEVAGIARHASYFDPHWEPKRGEVVAYERVKLYGLTLVARRPVAFGAVDPAAARDVFIRDARCPASSRREPHSSRTTAPLSSASPCSSTKARRQRRARRR